jgi:putative hydrolase of the HAD superfamily
MIDTVTFDLWNTLLSNTPQDNQRYREKRLEGIRGLLEESGLDVDFDSLYRAHQEGFEKCKETWKKNLDLGTQDQLKIMFGFLEDHRFEGLPQSLMLKLEEAFLSPILKEPPALIEGAKRTVKYVHAEGYKIGLICNTGRTPGRTIRELLRKLDLIKYFRALTFSNELRLRKPDPRVFIHTLNQLKSDPAGSVHVGDDLRGDILGAHRAGMISVHFSPDQNPGTEIQPDFSMKELTELKTVLERIKRSLSDVNNPSSFPY